MAMKRYYSGGQVPARPFNASDLAELRAATAKLAEDEETRSALERALARQAAANRRRDEEERKRKEASGPTNILKELLPQLAKGGKVGARPAAKPAAKPSPARTAAPARPASSKTAPARPTARPASRPSSGGGRKGR